MNKTGNKLVLNNEGKKFLKAIKWKIKPKQNWIDEIKDLPDIYGF